MPLEPFATNITSFFQEAFEFNEKAYPDPKRFSQFQELDFKQITATLIAL